MLHQIKLPGYAPILEDFLRFQQRLLEFACTPALSDPLTPDKVRQTFGDELGNWLVKELWKVRSGKPKIADDLVELTEYIKHHPAKRVAVLAAFTHDIDFYSHFDDPAFQFSYRQLDRQTQNKVKPLMVACYDLLADGFPCSGRGTQQQLSRRDVATIFWQENHVILRVCPACDGEAPRFVNGRSYSNVDHFFPKSRYPFLSIHPYNLVPICTDCNQYLKRDKDPVGDHQRETLIDIFHPYGRPAIQYVDVQTTRGPSGELQVHIWDKAYPQRVKNLERVLQLSSSWGDNYLPSEVGSFVEHLRDIADYRRDRGEQLSEDLVEDELHIILRNSTNKVGKQPYYVAISSYARYALSHQEELDRLIQVLMGRLVGQDEAVIWIW